MPCSAHKFKTGERIELFNCVCVCLGGEEEEGRRVRVETVILPQVGMDGDTFVLVELWEEKMGKLCFLGCDDYLLKQEMQIAKPLKDSISSICSYISTASCFLLCSWIAILDKIMMDVVCVLITISKIYSIGKTILRYMTELDSLHIHKQIKKQPVYNKNMSSVLPVALCLWGE
jgi:hypothetical protein